VYLGLPNVAPHTQEGHGVKKADRVAILRDLPSFVDLLLVGVEAGWSLDQCFAYLIENYQSPLSTEFGRVYAASGGAISREDALKAVALQGNIEDLTKLLSTIAITQQSGAQLAPVLRLQAQEIRREQNQRRQRKVRSTPTKMTLVTVVFIFPSILCTLLAPAVAKVAHDLLHIS